MGTLDKRTLPLTSVRFYSDPPTSEEGSERTTSDDKDRVLRVYGYHSAMDLVCTTIPLNFNDQETGLFL